jgi:deoxyribodipyrimidine photo-lyase
MNSMFPKPKQPITFPTDYASILERVNNINPIDYCKTRNFLDGAVTYLSPYISRGVISVNQIRQTTLAQGFPAHAIEKFLQELAWREYFQRVWQAKRDALFDDMKHTQTDVLHYEMSSAIAEANTGIEAIDEAVRAFYETGYLHNHMRMYVASVACNIGKAHWSAPAKWMYYHLLDGDLASNTCSWQWVAGTFSYKKYYCNQENINRFTKSNQRNTFLDCETTALPSLPIPAILQTIQSPTLNKELPSSREPVIDITKATLVYNSYNLDPRWHEGENVNRILLLEPSHFKKYPVGANVIQFILALSANIPACQIMVAEVSELAKLHNDSPMREQGIVSKEHPAFTHYPGIKEERDWMFPSVSGYQPSFFSFWKQANK